MKRFSLRPEGTNGNGTNGNHYTLRVSVSALTLNSHGFLRGVTAFELQLARRATIDLSQWLKALANLPRRTRYQEWLCERIERLLRLRALAALTEIGLPPESFRSN